MRSLIGFVISCLYLTALSEAERCPVHFKPTGEEGKNTLQQTGVNKCVTIDSADPLLALKWLTTEDTTLDNLINSKKESNPPHQCHIWSIRKQRIPNKCERIDFSFETWWLKTGCKVTLTYYSYISKCFQQISRAATEMGIILSSSLVNLNQPPLNVHMLRIHDNRLGSMPAVLSELYRHEEPFNSILQRIPLISLDLAMHPSALQDIGAGDNSAHAWNIWSSCYLLQNEGFTVANVIPYIEEDLHNKPLQYTEALEHFHINPNISRYDIMLRSKVLTPDAVEVFNWIATNRMETNMRKESRLFSNKTLAALAAQRSLQTKRSIYYNASSLQQLFAPDWIPLPPYCSLPPPSRTHDALMKEMSTWVRSKLLWKCHLRTTSSQCYKVQYIDPFLPCISSLQIALAEDYAWTMGWCTATHSAASIPTLPGVEVTEENLSILKEWNTTQMFSAFSSAGAGAGVGLRAQSGRYALRLGFLITVYRDAEAVMRLLRHLYSPQHVYVINIDASSTSLAAELRTRVLDLEREKSAPSHNIFLATGTPVVYMTSSASQILVQGMQWFLQHMKSFDYIIACTGSDYPLLPLQIMEAVLSQRSRASPFPSVMNWNHATWEDAGRLEGLSEKSKIAREVVLRERRPPHSPSEARGTSQFGIPLICHNLKSYTRLQARSNMEDSKIDSQWLFGKSIRKGKIGNVNAYEDPKHSSPPKDGVFRVWYKSDPATTAVFDRKSVEYIVNSKEGKTYYHFFKSMLLGSEEHYFISLLGNWKKTQPFVNQFSSMAVWNTWSLGSLTPPPLNHEMNSKSNNNRSTTHRARPVAFKSPHTSFLTLEEWPILQGLSRNGVFFARKFAGKYSKELLDQIDDCILFNTSFPSGELLLSGVRRKKIEGKKKFFMRKKTSIFAAQGRKKSFREIY